MAPNTRASIQRDSPNTPVHDNMDDPPTAGASGAPDESGLFSEEEDERQVESSPHGETPVSPQGGPSDRPLRPNRRRETPAYPDLSSRLQELRQTTRKVSMPQTGNSEAATPWDITSTEHLVHWARQDPAQLLEMLNQVRKERDVGIQASEMYEGEKLKRQRSTTRLSTLQQEFETVNNELEQLRRARESSTPSSVVPIKRSQKHPDPPLFTDGIDPTWEDWSSKMNIKLKVNKDYWDDDESRIGYVLSRLGGKAAKQTYSRQEQGAHDPFLTAKDVFDELATVFEDSDRKRNYRRQFTALKMGSMRFADFYSDFRRLSSFLKYDEDLLIEELHDKVANRLQVPWDNQQFEFETLEEAKKYMVKLDNSQRIMRENREKLSSQEDRARSTKRVAFAAAPTPSKTSFKPVYSPVRRSSPSHDTQAEDRANDNCFLCHKPGHQSHNCPDRKARPYDPHSYERDPRVHEITSNEGPDSDYQEVSEVSENDEPPPKTR